MFSKSFNDLIRELESLAKHAYVSEKDKEDFRKMLMPKDWDFELFEKAMVFSALLNIYPYSTPETIDLKMLKSFIDKMKKRTSETGNEHARSCFANIAEKKLIFGKTTMGDKHSCSINWDTPPGSSSLFFKRIMSIHTHPSDISGIHFSDEDCTTFLCNSENIATMVICADTELLTIKTFQTPKLFILKDLKSKINETRKKFLSGFPRLADIINFTKAICADNNLSLYVIKSNNGHLAEKVYL